jgi:aminomethyltransferase
MTDASMRRTPLYNAHKKLNARIVPFAGWEMPVQYANALEEHHATRQAAGLFDVSHMGEVLFEGPNALPRLQRLITNDLRACADGQAQYSAMLQEDGGIIDDIIVYRFSAEKLFVCVNAANRAKDFAWMHSRGTAPGCTVTDVGDNYAQIAVQGPRAPAIVQSLTKTDLSNVKTYWFTTGEVAGTHCIIARTGYTGEDGFELFVPPESAEKIWDALLEAGRPSGLIPAGLGARDSLRLESCYRLYGNDMDDKTTPLEAGLGWVVKLDKGEFNGRDVLVKQKANGLPKQIVGVKLKDKGIARHDYPVAEPGGDIVGKVTSGTLGPTLKEAVGMAYVPPRLAKVGTPIEVEIRGKRVAAEVAKMPFYKRPA